MEIFSRFPKGFGMARRLPRVQHLHLLRSSHFSLLERPGDVVPPVVRSLVEGGD
jgi:hypothetical protein